MIRQATSQDIQTLAEMAIQMWTDNTIDMLTQEFEQLMENGTAFFIKHADNIPVGFAQCSLRIDYVEGTQSSPVGYLEGIFVQPEHRNKGFAKELLLACEKWAKNKGCCEFASDCELTNTTSLQFHLAMGFDEANRIICFTKRI